MTTDIAILPETISALEAEIEKRGIKILRDRRGLELPPGLDYADYEVVLRILGLVARDHKFWIGDALVYGELAYEDDKYVQAAEWLGLAPGTVANIASVCRRVPPSRRLMVDEISFSHHNEVAMLPPAKQTEWLEVAAEERLSKNDLRARIKGEIPPEIRVAEKCECCGRPFYTDGG